MKEETHIVDAGRDVSLEIEIVNPPVYRASTVLYPDVASLSDPARAYTYGRHGTPTTRALEEAVTTLEHGARTWLAPSGLAAITTTLLAILKPGDHLLVADSVYGPTRSFCDTFLTRLNITTTYYEPMIGAGIAQLCTPATRAIFCESPGSQTFEVQDLPAMAAAAKSSGALVIADNTWATPLFYKPLDLGADISLHSATKYLAGHSDLVLGTITATTQATPVLAQAHTLLGQSVAADNAYLALRGLRSLSARMARHQENGLALARWLAGRPEVAKVLHPALESCPGHALWTRDFSGASGTFSIELKPCSKAAVAAFVDALKLFGLGYSFGGFESLVMPGHVRAIRTAKPWTGGPLVRFHVGFENVEDLKADITQAFTHLARAERQP